MKNKMISVLAAAAISIGIGIAATSSATAAPAISEMQSSAYAGSVPLLQQTFGPRNNKYIPHLSFAAESITEAVMMHLRQPFDVPSNRRHSRAWEGAGIGLMFEARRYEIDIAAQILTCQLLHEEGLLDNSQRRCKIGASVFFGNIHRLQ